MELQVIEQNAIIAAFSKRGGTDELFNLIAKQARSFVPDVTTDKGRREIGSVAGKVSSSKKLAEKYALDLVADQKAQIKIVDQDRIQFCKKMDVLRDEILAPRDAWVQAEADRIQAIEDRISQFDAGRVDAFSPSELIKTVIAEVEAIAIDESFQDLAPKASIAKDAALRSYRESLELATKREAEQAELERHRIAEQERLQRERDEQIAREAAEKATRDAEEKARIEAERVQQDQLQAAQREADLIAAKQAAERREQEAKIQADQQAKQAEIDRKNAIEAERKRIEAEQLAQAEAARKEEEARLADENHRKQICNEALQGLLKLNMSEEQGKAILRAIYKSEVPHVAIKF